MDDLLQEFVAETREMMDSVSGQIVAWEADPRDRKRLDEIFRFVHTVKGSCGFLDLPQIARLADATEEVLAAVRDGRRSADRSLVTAVLAIVDRIGELVEALDGGRMPARPDVGEELLIAALDASAPTSADHLDAASRPRSAGRSVRLSVDLLDRMMGGMSDMVLARNELARQLRGSAAEPVVDAAFDRLTANVAELRDTVTRMRMQKIDTLFSAVPRMVRDTATELGKRVAVRIEGADVELDREMVELIRDPLGHIIRNAVDHGIEAPDAREAIGKPAAGVLSVAARQSGNTIMIEIADDGRGIDVAALVAKARRSGLLSPAESASLSPDQQLDLAFMPGLSSRDTVTAISGRGVGMDVVRANVEQIGGRITLANRPGRGLTVIIQVPLTLSIMPAIIVEAGGAHFAIARQSVQEIVSVRGDQVRIATLGGVPVAIVRDRRLPMVPLASVLALARGAAPAATLVIVSTREGIYALSVDGVVDAEELVVKPGAPALMATGVYAGQTLPNTGRPMLMLDAAGIALAAGLSFQPDRDARSDDDEVSREADEPEGVEALVFEDLDGRRRAIPLAAVDRVETIAATAIDWDDDQPRLIAGEAIIPLHACARPSPTLAEFPVLRLTDGAGELAYAIAEPCEIVTLPPIAAGGPAGGRTLALVDGRPVELVDSFALFAGLLPPVVSVPPLCLLHSGDDGWMHHFLKPTIEAAGYRCVDRLGEGEHAAISIAMDDAADAFPDALRLRSDAGGGGGDAIYRYDRGALMAAIARRVAGAGA